MLIEFMVVQTSSSLFVCNDLKLGICKTQK